MTDKKRKRIVRSSANPGPRVQVQFGSQTRTKQAFKDECDINKIMAKFQKTGAVAHANRRQPEYGFASPHDFAESMRIVTEANAMFAELPSSLRARFANSPEHYLAFVQNPDNILEMADLGLLSDEAAERHSELPDSDPGAPGGTPPRARQTPAEPPQAQPDHPANE